MTLYCPRWLVVLAVGIIALTLQGCGDAYCAQEGLVGPAHDHCYKCVEKGRKKYGDSGGYKSICKKQAMDKYPPFGIKNPPTMPPMAMMQRGDELPAWTSSEKQELLKSLRQLVSTKGAQRSFVQADAEDGRSEAGWTRD